MFSAVTPFLQVPIALHFISSVGHETLTTVEGIPVFPDALLCSCFFLLEHVSKWYVIFEIPSYHTSCLPLSKQTYLSFTDHSLNHVYLCFFAYNICCTCSKKQWCSEFKLLKLAITCFGFLVYNKLYAFVNA